MQVEVHHVHAEVAGARLAHQGVHVGAVHIEQGALGVEDFGDLVDLAFEDADGRGIGEHQRGGLFIHLARERVEIDAALGVRLEVLDLVAADGGGCGIGAVGRVGDENFLARIALRLVPGADQKNASELAVRAGCGLQGDGVHAGDFDEAMLQQRDDFQHALGAVIGPVGVRLGQALDAGNVLIDARVVFHGAGAERIHAEIDGVVPCGEAREVADDFDLAQLGEFRWFIAVCSAEECGGVDRGDIERGHFVGFFAGRGFLEDQRFVLRLVGADFAEGFSDCGFGLLCHIHFPLDSIRGR